MKVLHGPVNVGNQPWVLSRAERRLGASSDLVTRSDTWLKYPADLMLSSESDSLIKTALRSAVFGLLRQWHYDVLHFYFGQTFVWPGFPLSKATAPILDNPSLSDILNYAATRDLNIARLLGKKLFMTLQGCDARLAKEGNERNEWTMCAPAHCTMYQRCVDAIDHRRRFLINEVLPLFDRVFYLNPELGHLVPNGTFLPYACVGIDNCKIELPSSRRRPRIVHAPTNAGIKGTPLILDALQQLRSRYDFELILVENKSHEEALQIYRSADLAIDQVLAGWYGGFAVEIMAMGKPVACYIRQSDLQFVPGTMQREIPVFNINPGNLVADLSAVLDRQAEWAFRGGNARRYVERWHNPDLIAAAMLSAYASQDSAFVLKQPDEP